jgi:uncharacterized SAM-binding protein YcdF (DUF218 family)
VTDLPTARESAATRDSRRTVLATGAALGALLCLELIAFGIPHILIGTKGYALVPIAALVGAATGLNRARRLLLAAVLALSIPLGIVGFTPVIRRPARALIRADQLGARPLQAVVVLSGGITDDGHLRQQPTDRLLTGLSLLRRGLATTLVLTRERNRPPGPSVTSDVDQQRLVSLLERPIRLLIVDSIFSTRDEAVRTRALARTLDFWSVAVVTSPLHTYRACATFEKVGFTVTCVPSESRDVALDTLRTPTDRVRALQLWLYELAGLAKYRVSGWI